MLASLAPLEREIEADNGAWYIRRILPYRTQDDRVEGVVITFADISEMKAAERADRGGAGLFRQHHRHRSASRWSCSTTSCCVDLRQPLLLPHLSRSSPEETVGPAARRRRRRPPRRCRRCAPSSTASDAASRVIEDHEIEIELPPLGRRSLLAECAGDSRGAAGDAQDPAGDRRHHRAQAGGEALEAAKREAEQANLGKSRFLAAASHDLRQPLQTLSLLQGILAKKVKDETVAAAGRQARRNASAPCRAC